MSKNDGVQGRFALFCDYALTSVDGKLSILGEFDQLISSTGKPVLNRGFLVGSFKGKPNSKADIEVSFINDKDENILPRRVLVIIFGSSGIANILVEMAGLMFENSGIYKGIFSENGKPLAEALIKVIEGKSNATKGPAAN